ncbi:unnamed protein product [Gulo gulo]|uniref:Uncharacterized protein n=1 Tax=Gulo gulo TaxID=48420 RepID=A0A9X9Q0J1_GULGU|nr:unnamed protein product [Gulo gulo]
MSCCTPLACSSGTLGPQATTPESQAKDIRPPLGQ